MYMLELISSMDLPRIVLNGGQESPQGMALTVL